MKRKDASDTQIADKLNTSDRKVSELSQRVKVKIIKVAIS
jgi:transcriptional regulator